MYIDVLIVIFRMDEHSHEMTGQIRILTLHLLHQPCFISSCYEDMGFEETAATTALEASNGSGARRNDEFMEPRRSWGNMWQENRRPAADLMIFIVITCDYCR